MADGMMGLADLPSRGILGVVDGIRPLSAAPGPAYICCQQRSPSVLVRNPAARLIDLYKLSRKRGTTGAAAAPAAAAAAGTKRPAAQQQQDDRAAKRQQQVLKGSAAAAAGAGAGAPPAVLHQQQQVAIAAGAAGLCRPSAQQQHTQHAQQPAASPAPAAAPLSARPNGNSSARAAAAAVPGSVPAGVCSSSKQLLQLTAEQMMLFSNKRLTELLRGCGCKVTGKKEDLVRRLLEYQRRVRKAAHGSSSSAVAPASLKPPLQA